MEQDNEDINEGNSDSEEDIIGEDLDLDETTIQMLKQNKGINYLSVQLNCDDNGKYYFNNVDWKKDGDCISNNTQLKTIEIFCLRDEPYILGEQGHNLPTREQLQDFFSCLYRNNSIKELVFSSIEIVNEFGGGLIEGFQGHPSLTELRLSDKIGSFVCNALGKVLKNPTCKLKNLRLSNCDLDGNGLGALCDGLLGNRTMEKLDLPHCNIDDEGLSALCDGLLGNEGMRSLSLRSNKDITTAGWRAFSTVLQSPDCKLVDLQLGMNSITNMGSDALGSAFIGSSVKVLDLSSNISIGSSGWHTLFNHLSQASIEKLNLYGNNLGVNGLAALASIDTLKSLVLCETKIDDTALALLANMRGNLKSLDINTNQSITPSGWRSFFNSLQTSATQLVRLSISGNRIGDVGAIALGGLLSNMNTLKTLSMNNMNMSGMGDDPENFTSQGWVSLFTSLQDSNLNLVNLFLQNNNIDDEGMQLLLPFVSRMTSLKELNLYTNPSVSSAGWQALTGYLQSPNVASEVCLNENKINDDTVVAFASALEQNKTLKWLGLYNCTDEEGNYSITERGWEAVSTLVCNKTSIMDTYNSNHTLFVDSYDDDEMDQMDLPGDLPPLLDLNRNQDKAEIARQKILQTHFSDNDTTNMQELLGMELEVMPTAIAWVGRPKHIGLSGKSVSGLSTMFNLMRRLPDLFDLTAQKKPSAAKRKRKDQ